MEIQSKLGTHPAQPGAKVKPDHKKDAEQFAKYTILRADQYEELEEQVNAYIREGWEPLGGLSDYDQFCAQAMIKPRPWIGSQF